jgi:hypothetical protein
MQMELPDQGEKTDFVGVTGTVPGRLVSGSLVLAV